MIKFSCIACGHLLQIQDYFAGCSVQCPSCKAQVTTPESPGTLTHQVVDSTLPTRAMPRPPALPPVVEAEAPPRPEPTRRESSRRDSTWRETPREEPMVAIPGLVEGASAANAIPITLPPRLEDDGTLSQVDAAPAATLAPPKLDAPSKREGASWREEPSWLDPPRRLPTPPPLPPEIRAEAAAALEQEPETSGKALASVILGMGTFLLPVICAIPSFLLGLLALKDIRRHGRLEGRGLAYTGIVLAVLGNLSIVPILMIKSSFDHARNERRVKSNLEEVARALLRYEMEHGKLPLAGLKNDRGDTTLSWRVALLPYLGQDALYREFKLDEPWDSPHNKKLLSRMPPVYASTSLYSIEPADTTHIQVITGLSTFFPEGAPRTTAVEFADSKFLVVEGREAVPWTKPEDLTYRRDRDREELPLLGASTRDGFYAGMADGSSRFVEGKLDRSLLHSAIDPSDRTPVFREKVGKHGKGFIDVPRDPFEPRFDFKDAMPKDAMFKDGMPRDMIPPPRFDFKDAPKVAPAPDFPLDPRFDFKDAPKMVLPPLPDFPPPMIHREDAFPRFHKERDEFRKW